MHDGDLPCDPASESPARSRLVNRAKEPFDRAVRGSARWSRRNRHRSLPERRAALSRTLRGRYACYGLSGSAPGRCTPTSSPPGSTTSTRASGWLNHVQPSPRSFCFQATPPPITTINWCLGGAKFVDMTDCVVWEEGDKFRYTVRNTCNEYLNLTVCWTGHDFHDINYRCDKSHPIPPANWGGLKPGESGGLVPRVNLSGGHGDAKNENRDDFHTVASADARHWLRDTCKTVSGRPGAAQVSEPELPCVKGPWH